MQRHLMYATAKSTGRVVKSTPNLRQREALPTFSCQLHAVFLKPYAVQFWHLRRRTFVEGETWAQYSTKATQFSFAMIKQEQLTTAATLLQLLINDWRTVSQNPIYFENLQNSMRVAGLCFLFAWFLFYWHIFLCCCVVCTTPPPPPKKVRVILHPYFSIGHYRNVRGLGKSIVVFRLFEKLRYSNERSTIF